MKRILIISLLFCLCGITGVFAQNMEIIEHQEVEGDDVFDQMIKGLVVDAVSGIFDDLDQDRGGNMMLKGFDATSISKNKLGFAVLDYEYRRKGARKTEKPFFILKFDVLQYDETKKLRVKPGEFYYDFPLLGLRIHGFQTRTSRVKTIELDRIVRKNIVPLWLKQQGMIQMRLKVTAMKASYHINQAIDIKVTLESLKKSHMKVKKLGMDTVQFYVDDNKGYVFPERVAAKEVILRAESSISNVFVLNGFAEPGEYVINVKYIKTISGVNPYGRVKVKVVE